MKRECLNCGEVEFEAGEGVRFAEAIKQVAKKSDARLFSPNFLTRRL